MELLKHKAAQASHPQGHGKSQLWQLCGAEPSHIATLERILQ